VPDAEIVPVGTTDTVTPGQTVAGDKLNDPLIVGGALTVTVEVEEVVHDPTAVAVTV